MFEIESWVLSHRLGVTTGIIAIVWLIRAGLIALIRRRHVVLRDMDRRIIGSIRNVAVVIITVTVLVIWLPQIQHFALSITAVAVAVVVATKELISCLTGTLLRQLTKPFAIGDWIRTGEYFGEVSEESLLTTTILELDPQFCRQTGRTVALPNSLFLTAAVRNQNFLKRYIFHTQSPTTAPEGFPFAARAELIARIAEVCKELVEPASRYNALLERRSGVDIPNADPEVSFATNDTGHIVTTVVVFCPTESLVKTHDQIVATFFDWLGSHGDSHRKPAAAG